MGSDRLYKEIASRIKMPEGRRCQVFLLDERRLELTVQPRLTAGELLDLVASHCSLREKEFFGLAVLDDTGHFCWLQQDKRVLEHELPKSSSNSPALLTLYFLVKFFVEAFTQLKDTQTVELFFLQARSLVFKGQVATDTDTAFRLAALTLQAEHGDQLDEEVARAQMRKLAVLPSGLLKRHPSLQFCEEQVLEQHRKLRSHTRGLAIVDYLKIVETLNTYGVHYYEVRDKRSMPWWLGVSCRGIAQYDYGDRQTPRRMFPWKHLENLYFRDRKFSIEVHDTPRRSNSSRSGLSDALTDAHLLARRAVVPGGVSVHVWFAKTQGLTKSIWQMAIAQHQFYLDRKQKHQAGQRSLSEIARGLSRSCGSLSASSGSSSGMSRSGSAHSISGVVMTDGDGASEGSAAARAEMVAALKARREALEKRLQERTSELRLLCTREAELTGSLPPETPLAPGEEPPVVRRRVGTSFELPQSAVMRQEETLSALELELELQRRICVAAQRLAGEPTAKRAVRRQRKDLWRQSLQRLRATEARLQEVRLVRKKPRPVQDGGVMAAGDGVSLSPAARPQEPSEPHRGAMYNLPQQRTSQAFRSLESLGDLPTAPSPDDGGTPPPPPPPMPPPPTPPQPSPVPPAQLLQPDTRRPSMGVRHQWRHRQAPQKAGYFGSLDRRGTGVVPVPVVPTRSLDRLDTIDGTDPVPHLPEEEEELPMQHQQYNPHTSLLRPTTLLHLPPRAVSVGTLQILPGHTYPDSSLDISSASFPGLGAYSEPPTCLSPPTSNSPKRPKEREWLETSLDSPLLPTRPKSAAGRAPVSLPETPQVAPEVSPEVMAATLPVESPANHLVVEPGSWQPYREVCKPFEMSDFYKYSTKFKRQNQVAGAVQAGRGGYRPIVPQCQPLIPNSRVQLPPSETPSGEGLAWLPENESSSPAATLV